MRSYILTAPFVIVGLGAAIGWADPASPPQTAPQALPDVAAALENGLMITVAQPCGQPGIVVVRSKANVIEFAYKLRATPCN